MKRPVAILLSLLVVATLVGTAMLTFRSCPGSVTNTAGQAVSGNLNLAGDDPFTLDPAQAGDGISNEYVLQIFSGLVRLDESLQPAPDIAQSWDITPDGLSYTFHLRQDVSFQDGRHLTAADVKYS